MVFVKTGMNLSNLGNVTQLDLNTTFTPSNIIEQGIYNLNTSAGIWAVGIIMLAIYLLFLWSLSDSSPFGDFKYSYLRASLLALCLLNALSITMISVGVITSFRIVGIFWILNILNSILVLSLDN